MVSRSGSPRHNLLVPLVRGLILAKSPPRKNLNETAFFFPHLVSNAEGVVKMEFTMPEALTEWKFMAFAHDTQLLARLSSGQSRYRQGSDGPAQCACALYAKAMFWNFTVKVSNQSDAPQKGTVSTDLHRCTNG